MDLTGIAGLGISFFATALTVATVLRGRQLARPRVRLDVSHVDTEAHLTKTQREVPVTVIAYGSTDRRAPRPIVVPIFISNVSEIAVDDVKLSVEYPAKYLANEITFRGKNQKTPTWKFRDSREVGIIGEVAHVSCDLGVLRPGEAFLSGEVLALRPLLETRVLYDKNGLHTYEEVRERLENEKALVSMIPFKIYLRGKNIAPIVKELTLLWVAGDTNEAVSEAVARIGNAAWDDQYPEVGRYFRPPTLWPSRYRKPWRKERCKVHFVGTFREALLDPDFVADQFLFGEGSNVIFNMPPWGLTGNSYNVAASLGVRFVLKT